MKTHFLFLFLIATIRLSAQIEFAPVGAVWIYDYARFQERGIERLECIGDTLINGESARVLTITRTYFDLSQPEDTLTRVFEHKYLRQSGDTVFLYDNEAFRMIYNFGAEADDNATVAWGEFPWSPTTFIRVISVSDTSLNGEALRVLGVRTGCNIIDYSYGYEVTWIEGIGALNAHLLYYSDYYCDGLGIYQLELTRFHLRCYSVNGEVIYTSSLGVDCDVLTQTANLHRPDAALSIFPNPAQSHITLTSPDEMASKTFLREIVLFDLLGRPLFSFYNKSLPFSIPLEGLPSGMYFLQVCDKESIITTLKFNKR